MKIAILSYYSGIRDRGVETWAKNLQKRFKESVVIISGNYLFQTKNWIDADVVIPTNGRFQVFVTRLLTFFMGKSMVVFGHSGLGADDKWNLLCVPNVFVSFSNNQKKWVDRYKFKNTTSVVITHAVDTSIFKPKKSEHDQQTILCVAANTPSKRVELVRKAVSLLKNIKLSVVGSDQVEEVAYDEMPKIYNTSDVFCFVPEPWEAFGLVYLEAMACNLPVVTINDPVRREIVGKAGIFVDDPENVKVLSSAIKKALSTDWGDRPMKQAEKFSWDIVLEKYKELFTKL